MSRTGPGLQFALSRSGSRRILFHGVSIHSFTCAVSNCSCQKMETSAAGVATEAPSKCDFSCNLEVDYESDEIAHVIYAALVVDKELQPDKVRRNMSISNGKLSVHFEAVKARFLRASYSAFVDVLTLATKTVEEFRKGMSS